MTTHQIRNPNIVATPLDHSNFKKKSKRIQKKKPKLNSTDLLTAVMPQGKYKGWFITQLPVDYLAWGSKNFTGSLQGLCSQALKRRLGSKR
jgi:uncharacterized protein (DUF3820 family)